MGGYYFMGCTYPLVGLHWLPETGSQSVIDRHPRTLAYLETNHRSAMGLWRETGRKYWLKRAASYWRQIERALAEV